MAQVTLYHGEGFRGPPYTTRTAIRDFTCIGFNGMASSVVGTSDRWDFCDDAGYGGGCVVLRQGQYPTLAALGLNERVSSLRAVARNQRVDAERYPAPPVVDCDCRRRRSGERLFRAPVTTVRGVMDTREQRCWIERQRVPSPQGQDNCVPAGIFGTMVGGILGHPVGGGAGRDIANVLGRDLHLPRAGAPCATGPAAERDHHGGPQRRTQGLKALGTGQSPLYGVP